ncbi:Lysylphosphatidylglycerol biosynthesis bifunctional protein LysX [Corynebacterium atrinae]|uniref:bifunctional lysylphosphatidylglycerol flippase/synthetase MprF n=1 Tax=Corynebacterium atrinae TaxID=1336740 RepID=UPI0025B4F2A9|nr:DUF2156 domain-containing protein [Corynebacterium atrinae]WJY63170.1 Lysylphosphatidylglycerol biosynthesis bifunctional protein LysX [Corynebacterium atrinae]
MKEKLQYALRQVGKTFRFAPLSLLLLAVLWILREMVGPNSDDLLATLGISRPLYLLDTHLLTAGLTASTRGGALLATLGILAFALPAERVLGTRRFALVALASYAIATPLGVVLAAPIDSTGLNHWGTELLQDTFLSPSPWIFGTLAVASGAMPLLWRRRTRLILVTLATTLLLFTGTLSDVVAWIATIGGILAGRLWFQGRTRPSMSVSLREGRILVTVIVIAASLGPVLAGLNPRAEGPFAAVTSFIWQPDISEDQAYFLCALDSSSRECTDAILMLQQSGFGSLLANLMPLILQVVIALGLMRGRRLAWWLSIAAQLVTMFAVLNQLYLLSDAPDGALLIINLLLIVAPWLLVTLLLILTRRLFAVRIDVSRLARGAGLVVGTWVLTAAAWLIGAMVLRGGFHTTATWALAFEELPNRFLPPALGQLYTYYLIPTTSATWALYSWVGVVFWLVTAYALYRLLMSVPNRSTAADQARAQQILESGTGDHLSWMTLWDNNQYWFAEDGYVAYRVHNGIAVTVGGPIVGAEGNRDEVADRFETFATSQGWQPAWYSVSADFAEERSSRGFQQVHVAEESILSTADTEFKGKKFQNIRTARNRAPKEGISTVWTTWEDAGPELREKIIELSEQWVSEKSLPEMGFTLGAVPELGIDGTKMLLAVGEDGTLHGITSWLPVYEDGHVVGYTLDVMRRNAEGFRPVIEYLLAEALLIAAAEGLQWISLSGAPLATSEVAESRGLLDVTLDKVGETMEPLYGFRSLAASKYKFHPEHHSWFLCYRDELSLPAIGLAVSSCYLPQLKAKDAMEAIRVWAASQREEETAS